MSKRGENIYKRKDNRWEGRYVKSADDTGKKKFGYVYAQSYKEVKVKLAEIKTLKNESVPINQKSLSLFCDEWLTVSRNRVKASSFMKYYNMINLHVKKHIGEFLPQNLSTLEIEKFSNTLLANGLSPKTVHDILVVLNSVLKYCKTQIDGLREIKIVYPKETKKEMRVMTKQEYRAFTDYLIKDADSVKFGILFAMHTGLRIGEICALKWGDISLQEKTVKVYKTMQRLQKIDGKEKTDVITGEAKSQKGNRVIPLTEKLIDACRKFYKNNPDAFVLTGSAQKFMEPRTLQYRIKKYADDCNIKDIHFHTLRHSFATRCIESGFEIKSLSEVLGHSSTKVTLDRYVHSSMELKRENMERFAANF